MSSQEEELSPPHVSEPEQAKRKKKQRACDYCRRKKSNGAEMPDHRCSRCIQQDLECTYEPINTRPPSKSYVQILENRLQNMEKLFAQLHPNVEIPKDFDGTLESAHWRIAPALTQASPSPRSSISVAGVSPLPVDSPSPADEDELDTSEDEREAKRNILESLKRITIPAHTGAMRYHGKSSNLMFLQSIIKQKYPRSDRPRSEPMQDIQQYLKDNPADFTFFNTAPKDREERPLMCDFPEPDLMDKVVDGFFENVNVYLPLLHKPTLQNKIEDSLHLRDGLFGAVVLLVCANGALWVDDPRLETDDGNVPGWKWFMQVDTVRWSILARPKLEDIQACALTAAFLASSNRPQGSWTVIGLGLRMAQDVGAHRKKMYATTPNVEDELWRRAVWALITMDRMASFGLGRPCGLHDEDFDLDLMTEVDDEYWLNPDAALAFKQPEGKPSKIAFANCIIRLQRILAYASRTIYSINKSKQTLGYVGPEWEQRTVAELDSALNKWLDTVPEHLKWDPNRQDEFFLNQSCTLYANYYLMQICIHRPFIQPNKSSRLPFPSLTICTNAARSAIHVMDTQFQKSGKPLVLNRLPLFTSGLVLLLNLWGGKRSGLSNEKTMTDVHKCMQMLKHLERHTYGARRLRGVLNGLISIGEFPPPGGSHFTAVGKPDIGNLIGTIFANDAVQAPRDTKIRANAPALHKADDARRTGLSPYYYSKPPITATSPATSSPSNSAPTLASNPATNSAAPMDMSFELPLRTEDLGRVPFHYGFSSPFANGTSHELQLPSYVQQQPLTYYPDPHQHEQLASATIPLSDGGIGGSVQQIPLNGNNSGPATFEMSLAEYSQLLAAMSVSAPSPPETNGQQMYPQGLQQSTATAGSNADTDVSMMFEDNMAEVWSSAPASLEWGDWGEYLNSISGMNYTFTNPPQGF
ncbi:hypothetical protein DICSQDRAFT_137505 [Dichomitus squalens LYAD-421 SS1]|uniref:Fungal-specific transcription factor domain-containing protein n=1 Tax=Dichomitus squalens (strain LYAD-421) TaxID=732165 RepID=R7SWS6_DICSQ|nr:uncharacterized protein DICSQDRAFT_137505 [Dichomitus squalens LYAD-421 SS1]EJF60413.1 hypothetical protein DICSQDRAFT_137505 [Dichomitus squalens LYAD-421 SS1]